MVKSRTGNLMLVFLAVSTAFAAVHAATPKTNPTGNSSRNSFKLCHLRQTDEVTRIQAPGGTDHIPKSGVNPKSGLGAILDDGGK
jgi:hypothetical protein